MTKYTVQIDHMDATGSPIIRVTNTETGKSILVNADVDYALQYVRKDTEGDLPIFGLNFVTPGHYW